MSGNMYSNQLVDGAIEVIVNRSAMIQHDLMIGKELYLADVLNEDGDPYKIRIVGFFKIPMNRTYIGWKVLTQ